MGRNSAEILLEQPAGGAPLVASGPNGRAYRVKCLGKILVICRTDFVPDRREDGRPSKHVWTNRMRIARRMVKSR